MFFSGRIGTIVFAALAMLFAGVLVILPGGQAPRIAGPCGKELCQCKFAPWKGSLRRETQGCANCPENASAAPRCLTFQTANGFHPAERTMALSPVVLLYQPRTEAHALPFGESNAVVLAANGGFALLTATPEVPLHPPRA